MKLLTPKTIKLTALATGMLTTTVAHAGTTWNMPMAYPASNYHSQNAMMFAEAVEKATGGKLKIRVHAGASLFKGDEIKRAVQTGQVFIGERLLSSHANDEPLFGTDSVPFLAPSFEEAALLWKAAKPIINQKIEEQNLKLLYSVPWPPQGLYTKKKTVAINDYKGLRTRGYNTITSAVTKSLGGDPVQIEYAELSQAIATGVVDSMISSGSSGYDAKIWESLNYYNDFQMWLPRNYVFVNVKEWNKLPKDVQETVEAIAKVTEYAATKEAQYLANWYLEQLRKNGMGILKPSAELSAELKKNTQALTDAYLKKTGETGKKIIAEYKKLRAEAGIK